MNNKLYVVVEANYYGKFGSIESFIDNDTMFVSWHEAVRNMCELIKARAEQASKIENLSINIYEGTHRAQGKFNDGDVYYDFRVCRVDTLDEEES